MIGWKTIGNFPSQWYYVKWWRNWNCTRRSGSCNFNFLKNSLVQINSKLNSKPYDYLYLLLLLLLLLLLFDNISCCFVLFVHQFWKVFQKAITEEQRTNMWSRECVSAKHWGHTSSEILALKGDILVARMLCIVLYWNIVILMSYLIWKGYSYTFGTVSGEETMF